MSKKLNKEYNQKYAAHSFYHSVAEVLLGLSIGALCFAVYRVITAEVSILPFAAFIILAIASRRYFVASKEAYQESVTTWNRLRVTECVQADDPRHERHSTQPRELYATDFAYDDNPHQDPVNAHRLAQDFVEQSDYMDVGGVRFGKYQRAERRLPILDGEIVEEDTRYINNAQQRQLPPARNDNRAVVQRQPRVEIRRRGR